MTAMRIHVHMGRMLRRRQSLGEVAPAERIAVLDRAVLPVEELERDVRDAELLELAAERLGAQVEEVLVTRSRVDVDRAQGAKRVDPLASHPDRIPREPALPE